MDANNAQQNETESQRPATYRDLQNLVMVLGAAFGCIERKLDTLIAALADEQGEEPAAERTLDGEEAGGERDQTQSL